MVSGKYPGCTGVRAFRYIFFFKKGYRCNRYFGHTRKQGAPFPPPASRPTPFAGRAASACQPYSDHTVQIGPYRYAIPADFTRPPEGRHLLFPANTGLLFDD